jgi:hypothetical protein
MGILKNRFWIVLFVFSSMLPLLSFSSISYADIVHFKDGRKIEVARAWEEGGQVKCERFGSVVGYPLSMVERIESNRVEFRRSLQIRCKRDGGIVARLPEAAGGYTVEGWIFLMDAALDINYPLRFFSAPGMQYRLRIDRQNDVVLENVSKSHKASLDYKIPSGKWIHMALCADVPNETMTVYVNGFEAIKARCDTDCGLRKKTVNIGEHGIACIDEVRIWDHVRSQEEIRDNMGAELSGNEDGLQAYYKFDMEKIYDDGVNKYVTDSTSNRNDGIVMRGTTPPGNYWNKKPFHFLLDFNAPVKAE